MVSSYLTCAVQRPYLICVVDIFGLKEELYEDLYEDLKVKEYHLGKRKNFTSIYN